MTYQTFQTVHSHIELLSVWLSSSVILHWDMEFNYLFPTAIVLEAVGQIRQDSHFSHQWPRIDKVSKFLVGCEDRLSLVYGNYAGALTQVQLCKAFNPISELS